jgi:prephenate dehydratase
VIASGKARRIVAFLGGPGSFSQEASTRFLPDCDPMPLPDFEAVALAVCQGSADVAVLPIHNSLAGPIDAVLALLRHPELREIGEELLHVHLHLLAAPGTGVDDIREVVSHRAALRQCDAFIAARHWRAVEAPSTAQAAEMVATSARPDRAAIASRAAADLHGLDVLASDIQDDSVNVTRFSIVERRNQFA